jgi:hypothetical protein
VSSLLFLIVTSFCLLFSPISHCLSKVGAYKLGCPVLLFPSLKQPRQDLNPWSQSYPPKMFHHFLSFSSFTENVPDVKGQLNDGPSVITLSPPTHFKFPNVHQGEWISYYRPSMFYRRELLVSKKTARKIWGKARINIICPMLSS